LVKIANKIGRVFFGNQERYEQATNWHKESVDLLDKFDSESTSISLSEVQFRLGLIDELVFREEKEQQEQRRWQYVAVFIMMVYIIGIAVVTLYIDASQSNRPTPIFSLPLSVVMWAATGSLAAILYRFYTEQSRIRLAAEVRWLIARPIIGIIMGAIVYFTVVSGLILLGASPGAAERASNDPMPVGRMEVYWIIAFLAGFSDKFYLGIINLLVEKTFRVEDKSKPEGNPKPENELSGRSQGRTS
jgi:hypothetical protein